jgi:hypothetical protein
MNLPDIETVSANVHEAWMDSKRAQGVTTRKAEDGEELMAPYEQLSEKAKELDRGTVKAVYAAIVAATPQVMGFGQALIAAQNGKRVARAGWNGKGMYVFQRPADMLPITFIPKVKSLPDSVKAAVEQAHHGETHYASGQEITVSFGAYLCLSAADSSIANGWLPSQTDLLATDWVVLD